MCFKRIEDTDMIETDDLLKLVMGNLKGSRKREVLSALDKDEKAREEYLMIKNSWAMASSSKEMSEYEVADLYLNFRKQMRRQKSFRLLSFSVLKYAAILIASLSIGAAGFWIYQNQKSYVYPTVADSGSGKSQLHLSNGTIIDLEKDESKIALSGDQKITINNEKVIDLKKTDKEVESKMMEVFVPFGKKSQLTLEDGTNVWLNAGSRMAFPEKFTGKKREIFLEGEGYFEVAHNREIPFFVNTGEIAVRVLGTRFDVSAYESDGAIEAVLIEGKVAISKRSALAFFKDESILLPNQRASYDRINHSIVVKDEPDVDNAVAWTEGVFKFHKQSINEVLNKLERYIVKQAAGVTNHLSA